MAKKFSDLVAADKAAIADVVAKREALRIAEKAVADSTTAVYAALETRNGGKAAILNADGSVSVFTSSYGGYYVSTVAGDFEIPEPEPEPEPEPIGEDDDEDLDPEDLDEDDDEDFEDDDDLDSEDDHFRL